MADPSGGAPQSLKKQKQVTDEMIEAGLLKLKNTYRPLSADGVSVDERALVTIILTAAFTTEGSDNG